MKFRSFARYLFAIVAVVSIATILAPTANAGTIAYMKVGTGDWTALGAAGLFSAQSGNLHGTYSVSPIPGTNTAELFSTSSQILNTGGTAVDVKFVFVSSDGFTSPNTPPAIQIKTEVAVSGQTGTVTSTSTAVHTFVASGDQFGSLGVSPNTPNILNVPNLIDGASLTQALGTPTDAFGTISTLNGSFTIGQELEVNLAAGSSLNLSITTTLAPEPSSMLLVGIGAFGMAGYGWRRRRMAQNAKSNVPA